MAESKVEVGLTADEKKTLNHLVDFWNSYVQLSASTADNMRQQVCDAVHLAQAAVAMRVAMRCDPDYWASYSVNAQSDSVHLADVIRQIQNAITNLRNTTIEQESK